MPVRKVFFAPDQYYHVYNRGSEKRTIFLDSRDYNKFLHRIKENSKKYNIDILCYCLMPNHFHFLLKQVSDTPITAFMNVLQLGHAKHFNTKYERVGPLFQGRFKAKVIESDEYLLQLSAYIHRNPIADKLDSGTSADHRNLLSDLHNYPYSSYRAYIGRTTATISKPEFILNYFAKNNSKLMYQAFVENFNTSYDNLAPLLVDL